MEHYVPGGIVLLVTLAGLLWWVFFAPYKPPKYPRHHGALPPRPPLDHGKRGVQPIGDVKPYPPRPKV